MGEPGAVVPSSVVVDAAIDVRDVHKTYRGRVHALRGVDLFVKRGEVFGLLGPNGAGKSTLVKILMTVIRPTRAKGTVLGKPVGDKATLARIGYLPEHHRFPDYLTGAQVIDYFGALAQVPRADRRKRTGELLELVGMSKWAKTRVRGYSKGMRQRIGIAQALINEPEFVALDEPTDGVDPVGRRDIRQIVVRLKEEGKTVFLNSHLLSELEMVCDRVAILVRGVVSHQGTIDELTRGRQGYDIEVGSNGHTTGKTDAASLLLALGSSVVRNGDSLLLPTGEGLAVTDGVVKLATTDATHIQGVIDALRSSSMVIRTVRAFRPSLEDLFMEAVTDPSSGKAHEPGALRAKRGGE